jgi:hypothetical protein
MNILEAVELMKIGKSVRRSSWIDNYRMNMQLGKANYNNVAGSTLYGVPVSFFTAAEFEMTTMPSISLVQGNVIESAVQLLIEDVVANDWVIYEG